MDGQVFVSGGTGFLGKILLLTAEREGWDATFTVYSRDENKQARIKARFPKVRAILGDIRDRDRLTAAMAGHEIVIHAAAMKHIPRGEYQPSECLDVNVIGSRNVILAARDTHPRVVLGISTDKACEPRNAYGLSKAFMERLWWEAAADIPQTLFTLVRYGNVVGSTLSVIPVFRQQLIKLGHVQVTHPNMTRFWMSPQMVVDTIHAGLKQPDGTTFIPRIPAMTVLDLVRAVTPNAHVEITSPRPGEKMHETLITEYEQRFAHENPEGFLLYPTTSDPVEPLPLAGEAYTSNSARKLDIFTLQDWIVQADAVESEFS